MPADPTDPPSDAQAARPGWNDYAWELPFPDAAARRAAWRHMLLKDEGLVRLALPRLDRVADGVWRSGQPNPRQLAAFAARGGRTVISLRNGRNFGSLPLEIEACHRLGLAFHVVPLRARRLPEPQTLLGFAELARRVETPVLLHCKSGSDRTGFAAALWLMLAEDRPLEDARRQLSLLHGHMPWTKSGLLGAVLDAYGREAGWPPMPLERWLATRYDPEAITAAFRRRSFPRWLLDRTRGRG
ncbi:MAG TPA: sulfur transferase domain-containing protein [Thermohalobaculum sp.]|nr:sulfur transferase domain-containing protein [Thermohalobaculum sp.]